MILRGFHLEHWRCIPSLDLDGLGEGIVVLHGPNRTGKSSLVGALRACLFDADHNTGGKEFDKNRPWNGAGPPKVVIDFATGGVDYRLTKVFSKKTDGTALLEKKAAHGWQVVEKAPKEASRKARELLGADKSTSGLNQLLWLEQGEIGLPDAARLDSSLEKQLVHVLGVLVTGRDLAFKQNLDKRSAEWFTEKGAAKKSSPIALLEQRLGDREKACNDERVKLAQWEDAIRKLEACEDEMPQRRCDEKSAEQEYKALEEERERSRERRNRYRLLEEKYKAACDTRDTAEKSLSLYKAASARSTAHEKKVAAAHAQVHDALQVRDRATEISNGIEAELAALRKAEDDHHKGRDEIDDRRALCLLSRQRVEVVGRLAAAREREQAIAELEVRLARETAPDEGALAQLRNNRGQARLLRARLEAAELSLSLTLQRPMQVHLALDDKPPEPLKLASGEKKTWPVRQRAELEVPGVGTIHIARSREDRDLERAARDLARLDRDYEDSVRSFHEEPADETCLDRLIQRRLEREAWSKSLKKIRQELQSKAPAGYGALETEIANLDVKRAHIVARHPDLDAWEPSEDEIDERDKTFKRCQEELEKVRKARDTDAAETSARAHKAEKLLQDCKEALAGALAAAQGSADELQRAGEEKSLLDALEQATLAKAEAERHLSDNRLTEEEETVDGRLAAARASWDSRKQRLVDLETRLHELRGLLQGNEGLHARVADAETAVQETAMALARARLEADAHRRLRDLFDECRESQVQRVMGPVAGRVLDWARKIGLDEYREVCFGDQFLPEGFLRNSGAANTPIELEDESYGTGEQLSLLVRLALGGVLAKDEPAVAVLDDPLAHADIAKHRRILDILRLAADGNAAWSPPAGRLQIIILTCHPDRFDHLPGARHINLADRMSRA